MCHIKVTGIYFSQNVRTRQAESKANYWIALAGAHDFDYASDSRTKHSVTNLLIKR